MASLNGMRIARLLILLCVLAKAPAGYQAVYAASSEPVGSSDQVLAGRYNAGQFTPVLNAYKARAGKGDQEAYLNLAVIFKDLGMYNRAVAVLEKARRRGNDTVHVRSLLGRLYYLAGNCDKAIAVLQENDKEKSGDIDTLITLGLCFQEKKDDARAQSYFESALAQDEHSVIAHLSLADLYYCRHKVEKALKEYKEAGLLDASMTGIQRMVGELWFAVGNMQEAFRVYQRLGRADPSNSAIRKRLEEIKNRLGKDFFLAEREKRDRQKSSRPVLVRPFHAVPGMTDVNIGLIESTRKAEFLCSTPFEVRLARTNTCVVKGDARTVYRMYAHGARGIVFVRESSFQKIITEPVIIKPLKPEGAVTLFNIAFGQGEHWANVEDRSYRGSLKVVLQNHSFSVINIVSLEEYLYSVVPSEISAEWPIEALKAQAVAARSAAFSKLGRHKKDGFDMCPGVHCQVYNGVRSERPAACEAVDATRGEVMYHGGKLIDAVYSDTCGGHTQGAIFGEDMPYVRSVYDGVLQPGWDFPLSPFQLERWFKEPPAGIYCNGSQGANSSNFRWVRVYSAEEIDKLVAAKADIGSVEKIIVLRREKSGHISRIKIKGTNGSYIIEKEGVIRGLFGNLRSSSFKVEIKYDASMRPMVFIFYGAGWGHAAGMCQFGARGMALCGIDYHKILQHYYDGIEFKRMY